MLNNLKKQPDLSVIIQRQNFNFHQFFSIMLLLRACDIGCGKYGIFGVINIYILHTVGYKEQCYRMSMTNKALPVAIILKGETIYIKLFQC